MEKSAIFTTISAGDLLFMAEGALRTINLTAWSAVVGTVFGLLIGVGRASLPWLAGAAFAGYVDVLRSVPLLIQFILANAILAVAGFQQPPFVVGVLVLSLYMSAYVSEVVRGGVGAVPELTRRAGRSLGLTWLQDMRYVVLPLGLRAVFPAWIGLVIGLVKDTSLIAVIGYIELLRAGQIIITRTQEPMLVLTGAGLFYFVICFPVSRFAMRLERRMAL
jgi:polar amino acid transport system permease protein